MNNEPSAYLRGHLFDLCKTIAEAELRIMMIGGILALDDDPDAAQNMLHSMIELTPFTITDYRGEYRPDNMCDWIWLRHPKMKTRYQIRRPELKEGPQHE